MNAEAADWPELDESYTDAFGHVDAAVYAVARALWPRARNYAHAKLNDEAAGQRLLFKAVAAVSRQDRTRLKDLEAYLWTSFERLVLDELRQRQREHGADGELEGAPNRAADAPDQGILQDILIDEIVCRMTPATQQLFNLLTLGYSYEESARMLGTQANVLRSKLAKEIQRIKQNLHND
ncbi:MAG: sigma-70 family RNA polymerase sigma factor [Acidobacteria bacterium]|nr:sigma-70 family RNA polymerase sigma factor [Acidobacteriota bacterium]MBI3426853.1 sigma-70 family RNA polymerase sigma factor [Acidobacteriota bacterium]